MQGSYYDDTSCTEQENEDLLVTWPSVDDENINHDYGDDDEDLFLSWPSRQGSEGNKSNDEENDSPIHQTIKRSSSKSLQPTLKECSWYKRTSVQSSSNNENSPNCNKQPEKVKSKWSLSSFFSRLTSVIPLNKAGKSKVQGAVEENAHAPSEDPSILTDMGKRRDSCHQRINSKNNTYNEEEKQYSIGKRINVWFKKRFSFMAERGKKKEEEECHYTPWPDDDDQEDHEWSDLEDQAEHSDYSDSDEPDDGNGVQSSEVQHRQTLVYASVERKIIDSDCKPEPNPTEDDDMKVEVRWQRDSFTLVSKIQRQDFDPESSDSESSEPGSTSREIERDSLTSGASEPSSSEDGTSEKSDFHSCHSRLLPIQEEENVSQKNLLNCYCI